MWEDDWFIEEVGAGAEGIRSRIAAFFCQQFYYYLYQNKPSAKDIYSKKWEWEHVQILVMFSTFILTCTKTERKFCCIFNVLGGRITLPFLNLKCIKQGNDLLCKTIVRQYRY